MPSHPDCHLCPLWELGARSVGIDGDGPLDAEVLIVGEAPGEIEDGAGRVFCGKSGQFLRAVLEEKGIEARITNVIRCHPPGNRDPKKEELAACLPYLHEEIRSMTDLKLLIPVSRFAWAALGGKGKWLKKCGIPSIAEVPDAVPQD